MSTTKRKAKNPLQHLIAGGCAGFVESSICHPLDTIKTRMQLRRQSAAIDLVKARSSLMEPALRLQHSLMEPLNVLNSSRTPSTAPVTASTEALLHQRHLHEPQLKMTNIQPVTKVSPTPQMLKNTTAVTATLGPIGTARRIVQREGFFALYKGLTAVYTGIVPKMAIRFVSFEQYKEVIGRYLTGAPSSSSTVFLAGLMSGLTEAIMVVTPAEVCKIRMQSQYHSLMDPTQMQHRKYTNVIQTGFTIVREEGLSALYKGVVPTMLRQGCNQAVNFTGYQFLKRKVLDHQQTSELYHWQSLLLGGLSGGMGPLVNNPLDVVKTRMQKQVVSAGKAPKYKGLVQACGVIAKEEGVLALWKGVIPRLLRIMPGQAITFMTYEAVNSTLVRRGYF